MWNGETVVDSSLALLAWDTRPYPFYYFPMADVRMEMLVPAKSAEYDSRRGSILHYSLAGVGRREDKAAWRYEPAAPSAAGLKDHICFRWESMDRWFEEDVEVFVHARDPFNRVDILDSSRRVQVYVGGEVVADSTRARFLFETGWMIRYYLPPEDVRQDLLVASNRVTHCPYKGKANYHSVQVSGRLYPDLAWSYADPVEESAGIKGRLCFSNEQVEAILVDGEPASTRKLAKQMTGDG